MQVRKCIYAGNGCKRDGYTGFQLGHLNLCRQELLEYQKVTITGEELRDCETEEESYDRLEMLLNLMPQVGMFWIGGDLGYTNDPTEIVVFQEIAVGDRSVVKLSVSRE